MKQCALVVMLVACNSPTPTTYRDKPPAPECPGCKDPPAIPGASILYSGGGGPLARVRVVGDTVVFQDPTCCLYVTTLAGGPTTTLVRRTSITDFTISGDQVIYVGLSENAERLSVAGVALPGHEGTKVFPRQDIPGEYDRGSIAATADDVYVVAQTLRTASLFHWSVAGDRASNVTGGGSLVADATRAYLVQGTALHLLDREGSIGASLGELPDALPERFALTGDTLYYTTSRSIERAHLHGTTLERDAWSIDAKIVDSIAADQGRIVWSERHTIYTTGLPEPEKSMQLVVHPAKAMVIDSLGDAIVGLALARGHVVWSVPYTYGPNAKTTEERLETQKTGFVATAPLPK